MGIRDVVARGALEQAITARFPGKRVIITWYPEGGGIQSVQVLEPGSAVRRLIDDDDVIALVNDEYGESLGKPISRIELDEYACLASTEERDLKEDELREKHGIPRDAAPYKWAGLGDHGEQAGRALHAWRETMTAVVLLTEEE